ncbi:MAG TPA: hypothetical protein VFE94_04110 [Candidatus Paceibacterota bacterium]|nr:hypothetical protein [Candidatus Paceibacterota bacterium]
MTRSEWLLSELRVAGLSVASLNDRIADHGMIGDPRWHEIRWIAESKYLGGNLIPDERFEALETFEDLLPLIAKLRQELQREKTRVLSTA